MNSRLLLAISAFSIWCAPLGLPIANGQQPGSAQPKCEFLQAVEGTLAQMRGTWTTMSMRNQGTEIPLDQVYKLTVDDNGFTLHDRAQEWTFEFVEFRLSSKTFLATCSSADYPQGLIYEIGVSNDVVRIRYRMDGNHVSNLAPEQATPNEQLAVQDWTRNPGK